MICSLSIQKVTSLGVRSGRHFIQLKDELSAIGVALSPNLLKYTRVSAGTIVSTVGTAFSWER
ncbi:hypothetical protein [Alkalibacterium thalassium]|uniref:hypothetical protein n=1 Tax=Alkalibacterium thalassium TaxID=426701 RepID=UPI001FDEF9C4|nr:hypothetical protein [Alkalibacterium thalassium]